MPRTRPPYPEEFRRGTIKLALLGDKPQRQLAKDLGISDVTLRHWIKQDEAERGERPGGLSSEEGEELARLRNENARLRMEREILSKRPSSSRRRATGGRRGVLVYRRGEGQLSRRCDVPGPEGRRTGFHHWERRAPSDRALTDAWLTEKIKRVHEGTRGVYGAPRIHAELRLELAAVLKGPQSHIT